ncbi:EAL domain-containing protein, partial [Klebsiella pneumoniae]|uniref:EAL domain-containing protein n=1 Tax=Klebsiella pneumoniae TaxID=573 RepID=UPI001F5F3D43
LAETMLSLYPLCGISLIHINHQRLGLATIAEGVSTQQQAEWLKDNRVSYVQGYLYARPMPAADFISWYEENNRKRETVRT